MGQLLLANSGTLAKRNDTGAIVRILEMRPCGLEVFYRCENVETGEVTLVSARDLRPAPREV
jgi:hypothetical protein